MMLYARSAIEAREMGYGGPSYWEYLDRAAVETRDYFRRHPELGIDPEEMLSQSLGQALRGNDGP